MPQEKKIFLAYVYRSLNLLYSYLYKHDAHLYIDGIVAHDDDRQSCYAYTPISALPKLALHKYAADKLHEQHGYAHVPTAQLNFINKLLQNQLPTISEALQAKIINITIDRYNPLFAQYFNNL